ncbi:MAG: MarR family transcriptional regulator [Lentisphaeria bacterium]|nr:MarR family transcriptional regulator [Lentisphaeria bacterium]
MKGLTQKQKNIIEFINEFMTTQEMAPTIYEIAEHFHIKTSTVFAHIRALQKKNYLTRSSKARSISLSHPKKRSRFPAGVQSIPFHCIGEASAAEPGDKTLVCDVTRLLDSPAKEDLYAVHVHGSDLNSSGIFDGDILIVKSNPATVSGEDIVVAEENGREILKQAKDAIVNGTLSDAPNVKGVVVGLQRRIART